MLKIRVPILLFTPVTNFYVRIFVVVLIIILLIIVVFIIIRVTLDVFIIISSLFVTVNLIATIISLLFRFPFQFINTPSTLIAPPSQKFLMIFSPKIEMRTTMIKTYAI